LSNKPLPVGLCLAFLFSVSSPAPADEPHNYTVVPGSKEVNAAKIQPYEAHWNQLALGEGGLKDTGVRFREVLERDGDTLRHMQSILRDDETLMMETRILARDTLVPVELRREASNPPEGHAKSASLKLDGLTYAGSKTLADGTSEPYEHSVELPSFDGWIAGVVLAALPLSVGYEAKLPTVVHLQQTNFQLIARVSDERMFERKSGVEVPVWVVDTDWVDIANGSVSKGGPGEAGGTYLIAKSPGSGIPYVIEYANSFGVIRWSE